MADRISLIGIRGYGFHGVLEHERANGQEFVVDLHAEIAHRVDADDLARTLDYSVVAAAVHALITGTPVDLLETLAEQIATVVLDLGARSVSVQVHKPQAPIPVPFDDVIVTIERTRITAVLSLGANLAEPIPALRDAVRRLGMLPGAVLATSEVFATEPVGGVPQDDFANVTVILRVDCTPEALLESCLAIEADAGRLRVGPAWGPRVLDIDLIDVRDARGPIRSGSPVLTLPHPRARERGFVLMPWLQVDPTAVLTDAGPVRALVDGLPADHPAVRASGVRVDDVSSVR